MAVGSYGIVRPADVSPADVDIFYHFVADRTTTADVTFEKLDTPENYLTPIYHTTETLNAQDIDSANKELLGGLYNLKLPKLKYISYEDQSNYKYLLNIEGNTSAYRFSSLFYTNSLIINIESKSKLWFEPLIKHNFHYIKLDIK